MAVVGHYSPYEIQQKIIDLYRKKWWIFVLGSKFSAVEAIDRMLQRPEVKEIGSGKDVAAMIFDIQIRDTIRIFCIDSIFLPRQTIMEYLMAETQRFLTPEDARDILNNPDYGPIFVPLSVKNFDVDPEEILQDGLRIKRQFDEFIHNFLPPPPSPMPLDPDQPVLIPNFVGRGAISPKIIAYSGWLTTGHPTETHVRFFGWQLSDGTECSAVVTVEVMDHVGMVRSNLLHRGSVVPDVESNLIALKQWVDEVIRVSVAQADEAREEYRLAAERKAQHGKERPPAGSQ